MRRRVTLTTLYYRHIVPAVLLLLLAGIAASYFLVRRILQGELDAILLRSKSRVQNYIRVNNRLPEISTFDDQLVQFSKAAVPAGGLPYPGKKDSVFSDTMQYIPEQQKYHISRKLVFTVWLNGQPWEATIVQPLEGTRHLTILIVQMAIVTISVTLFLFMLIIRRILSKIWKPFYQSLQLIEYFKVDNPNRPAFPDSNIEEFRLMNAHFAKAADNAKRDYRNLKEFSENASHELQTPLAIIRSNLDMMAQEPMTERQSQLLQGIYASVRRMTRLQESLLLLTKIDNRQYSAVDDIRVDLVLHDKVQQLHELLHARNLHCRLDLSETSIPANRELLDILLNNLFSNAIRHNIKDGEIYAQLRPRLLRVTNTGPDKALDNSRIFRRFYKNPDQPGNNGLGLSIIKQICDTTAMQVQYEFAGGLHSFTISW